LRATWWEKVEDLIGQAMLRPDLARALFNKVPSRPNAPSSITLRNALNRASMFAAANAGLENRDGQPLPMAAGMGR
jgi:hypothetical protein